MSSPDLARAASALDLADGAVRTALAHLAAHGSVDADQIVSYDLAHAAAALATARNLLDYGERGEVEAKLALAFAVLLTGPGVPLIYYGDEIGLAGGGDPNNRRMMPWDEGSLNAPQKAPPSSMPLSQR